MTDPETRACTLCGIPARQHSGGNCPLIINYHPAPAPTTRAIPVDVAELCERLRGKKEVGRSLGGGNIAVDASGGHVFSQAWGNGPIMALRNPDGPEAATTLKTLAAERDAALGELAEASEAIERLTVASGQLLHDAQAERQVREMAATSGGFYAATSRNMEQRATAAEAREETLAAENARLQVRIVRCESEVAATEDVGRVAVAAATKAEAENARLREALEHISEGQHDRRMTGQRERAYREALARAQGVARAALSPVTQVNEPHP